MQKRGIEKMLEGELDAHLDYDKHDSRKGDNARNGYSNKKIKTSYREEEIKVPRDRDASFYPMAYPQTKKYGRRSRKCYCITLRQRDVRF